MDGFASESTETENVDRVTPLALARGAGIIAADATQVP